jgi:hypothetical protein
MIKIRGGGQIGNLTPAHKPLESEGQMSFDWGVLYTIEKIFLKAIRYCPRILKIGLLSERYECPKFWDNKSPNFGTSIWVMHSQAP